MTMDGSMPLSFATTSIICCSSVAIRFERSLELHFEPCPADDAERYPVRAAPLLKEHLVTLESRQPAEEVHLPFDRFGRDDLRQPAPEPPVIPFAAQRPVEAGRRDLERELAEALGQRIVDVDQCAQVLADPLALLDADGLFLDRGTAVEHFVGRRGAID